MTLRKTLLNQTVLGLTLLFGISLGSAEAASIRWYTAFQQAMAAAQEANKPIMIEFWADWCSPCKVMETEVYTDAGVVAVLADKMIAVRLNFDNQKELVRRYNVEAIPHLVFTDSYGLELLYHRGILGAKDLTAVIDALPMDISEINRLDRILQKDNDNFEALEGMASLLRTASLYISSNEFYEKALKRDEAKKNSKLREAVLLRMGLNFLELKDGKHAAPIFERCIKEFSMSEDRPNFLFGLSQAYVLMEKKVDARKLLDSLIATFPQSEAARKARAAREFGSEEGYGVPSFRSNRAPHRSGCLRPRRA